MTFNRLLNMFTWLLMEADTGAPGGGAGDKPQGDPAQVPPPDQKGGSTEPLWTKERAERERRSGGKDFLKKLNEISKLADPDEIEQADDKKLEEIVAKLIGNLGEHKQLKD